MDCSDAMSSEYTRYPDLMSPPIPKKDTVTMEDNLLYDYFRPFFKKETFTASEFNLGGSTGISLNKWLTSPTLYLIRYFCTEELVLGFVKLR